MVKDAANWAILEAALALKYPLLGDTTAGRVVRSTLIKIEDGAEAAHIKCTTSSKWNGDVNAAQDNIGKDGVTTGVWSLNAAGTVLTLLATGISGDCVGILGSSIVYNASRRNDLYISSSVVSGGIQMSIYDALNCDGSTEDLSTLVDTGYIQFTISYVTSA
jgi:hypothetical protein